MSAVLAATNRDLEAEIAAGRFREDLFYRLNVIEVTVPPLRQRPADILPLAEHLLRFFARQNGKPIVGFCRAGARGDPQLPWPGNIRELRNAVERAVILASEDTGRARQSARPGHSRRPHCRSLRSIR